MFSSDFRKTPAWDYQRRLLRPPPTRTVTLHVGTDYAGWGHPFRSMWAVITVKRKTLPTSQRKRCPHQTESGAHIQWNRVPTSTGIRTPAPHSPFSQLDISDYTAGTASQHRSIPSSCASRNRAFIASQVERMPKWGLNSAGWRLWPGYRYLKAPGTPLRLNNTAHTLPGRPCAGRQDSRQPQETPQALSPDRRCRPP